MRSRPRGAPPARRPCSCASGGGSSSRSTAAAAAEGTAGRRARRRTRAAGRWAPCARTVARRRAVPLLLPARDWGWGRRRAASPRSGGATGGDGARRRRAASGTDLPDGESDGGGSSLAGSLPPALEAASITGRPFVRAPLRGEAAAEAAAAASRSGSRMRPEARMMDSYNWGEDTFGEGEGESERGREGRAACERGEEAVEKVPVGVDRLHSVRLPSLLMEPMYWLPVNDVAPVVRGTWFYWDNMHPVESDVANLLEAGYVSMEVWTQTWKDELNSAVEVGAVGEMKIVHKLWPEKAAVSSSRPSTSMGVESMQTTNVPECAPDTAEKVRQDMASAAGDLIDTATGPTGPDNKAAGSAPYGHDGSVRLYRTAAVIYANDTDAYIIRPSLQPSAYYGRRPLANYIRRNRQIGIRVVRGFSQENWDRAHPPTKTSKSKKPSSQLQEAQGPETKSEEVTDLLLVVHGIGQKLSERVESYHFTHAINSFRREMNVELKDDFIKLHLREGMGKIMALPVRHQPKPISVSNNCRSIGG